MVLTLRRRAYLDNDGKDGGRDAYSNETCEETGEVYTYLLGIKAFDDLCGSCRPMFEGLQPDTIIRIL